MYTPTELPAWKALQAHYSEIAPAHMRDLFRDDRVDDWSFARTLYAAFVRVPLGTVLLAAAGARGGRDGFTNAQRLLNSGHRDRLAGVLASGDPA